MDWLATQNPIVQALLAGIFTWFCTAAGASVVFFVKNVNEKFLAVMQGSAAGIMTAASFWSLLLPSLEFAEKGNLPQWLPSLIGFMAGGLFLRLMDKFIPHFHIGGDHGDTNPSKINEIGKSNMLFLAVTIHNFPEGMALGVAWAAAALSAISSSSSSASIAGALALTIGIGLQNIPEGSALSLPIRASGKSKRYAFHMGQLSAIVEPIGAVFGAFALTLVTSLLPYALSFAAGAMLFVVVEELIPESQGSKYTDIATMSFLVGFSIMMVLDVALG